MIIYVCSLCVQKYPQDAQEVGVLGKSQYTLCYFVSCAWFSPSNQALLSCKTDISFSFFNVNGIIKVHYILYSYVWRMWRILHVQYTKPSKGRQQRTSKIQNLSDPFMAL